LSENRAVVAAYLRVSSKSQDLRTQRAALERLARARGLRVRRWINEKQSGRTLARPELDALRASVRRGEVRTVLAFALDRLTRSGIRDTFTLVEEFREAGCKLITVTDGFSLDGPGADVVVAVLAWAAQMERQRIGERISAARARVEAQGGAWGRPRRVAGELARRVLALSKTRSVRAIAVALKIPRATVQDELARARARNAGNGTLSSKCRVPRTPRLPDPPAPSSPQRARSLPRPPRGAGRKG
jgi:DNA invertase Pin-like site-specific DNA recombinase